MSQEDRELVARTHRGDRAAFERLVEKYAGMAAGIAGGIAAEASEDLVQDAFLQAFASLHTLRDGARFRPWLAGIVRSRAIDWLRRRRASPEVRAAPSRLAARPDERPEDLVEREEACSAVRRALLELPARYREVIVLRHWGQLSYAEIARATGSTVPAVESRLFRARKALRRLLGSSEGEGRRAVGGSRGPREG